MTTPTCDGCKHWFTTPGPYFGKMGLCKRNAPTPLVIQYIASPVPSGETMMRGTVNSFWPASPAQQSCGEWSPRVTNGTGAAVAFSALPAVPTSGEAEPVPQPVDEAEGA